MRILFVVNNFFMKGNGLSTSAQRTVHYLREAGEDVRILSCDEPQSDVKPEYSLPITRIPIFDNLVHKQGYCFAAVDRKVIKEAV